MSPARRERSSGDVAAPLRRGSDSEKVSGLFSAWQGIKREGVRFNFGAVFRQRREINLTPFPNDLLPVTKDDDFHRPSVLLGPPPNVAWLRLRNRRTANVLQVLRQKIALIVDFITHPDEGFLALR
jgi:predicted nuclease of predicted toxin-antitoxin system